MGAENRNGSCLQRDSAERKGHVRAHRSFNRIWKERDSAEPDLLGKILDRNNLNRAFKGVPCIRYADDIVLLAKSERAAKRMLETSTKYLEETLKLKVNQEKSRVVSVFAIRNFKYLGFALGRNGSGSYVRVHPKSWAKFRNRLRELSSRRHCQSIRQSLKEIEVYARGWLNYYGIASMKNSIDDINGWLYHRIRMCIWKQWKKPKTKVRNLIKLGVPEYTAYCAGNTRRGYWWATHTVAVNIALSKERLIRSGFYDLAIAYQSVHVNY